MENTDYDGGNLCEYKTCKHAANAEECCAICHSTPNCVGASLYQGICYTKGDTSKPVAKSGCTAIPAPRPSAPPIDVGRCKACPALQTFDDPQFRQNCPDQGRFQWIKDLIAKGCNQDWTLGPGTYYIDRQYLLPCGVHVK